MSFLENYPRITPFLWFDSNAEEAVDFYLSIFKNSRRLGGNKLSFALEGQIFTALNGGPMFKFTEAVSFVVRCDSQEEVDYCWSKLSEGGSEVQCGWLKDKFGLSWQIIPTALGQLMGDKDPAKSQRVMQAMLQMRKIDIAKLREACEGGK